jgi:hypothetical protein
MTTRRRWFGGITGLIGALISSPALAMQDAPTVTFPTICPDAEELERIPCEIGKLIMGTDGEAAGRVFVQGMDCCWREVDLCRRCRSTP